MAVLCGQAGSALIPPAHRLLTQAEVRRIAAGLGLRPTKQRGQNFVVDANTVRRIVRTARLDPGDVVLEVGPGLGSLTLALLEVVREVVAVEVDPRLAAVLPETVARLAPDAAGGLTTVEADATTVTALPGPPPTRLVANLPYNVAVPLLLGLLDRIDSLTGGLIMVQSEVADRLTAGPGSRVYGVPSVKTAWYAEARPAGQVPRTVFWPVPNVDSALVAFTRREPPGDETLRRRTFAVVDAAFAQRRKMLRSALRAVFGSATSAERTLVAAGIDPRARGEQLDLDAFVRLGARWRPDDVVGESPPVTPGG